jgi:hypothetical protein
MLIPLTDPEHPLAKQMLRLIGEHSHRSATVDAQSIEAAPVDDADADDIWTRRGRTLRARLAAQRERPILTPTPAL